MTRSRSTNWPLAAGVAFMLAATLAGSTLAATACSTGSGAKTCQGSQAGSRGSTFSGHTVTAGANGVTTSGGRMTNPAKGGYAQRTSEGAINSQGVGRETVGAANTASGNVTATSLKMGGYTEQTLYTNRTTDVTSTQTGNTLESNTAVAIGQQGHPAQHSVTCYSSDGQPIPCP